VLNETYSEVSTGRHLSDVFPNQNDLKQEDGLSPLSFNFASECASRKQRGTVTDWNTASSGLC
jgi:hypothetical protein